MKKVIGFLRSMKFGMLLLVLVAACSVAGSLIVQQREPMEYVNRYGADTAELILALGLDDVFSAPYFLALMAALCLNLTMCSIVRLPKTRKAAATLSSRAAQAQPEHTLPAGGEEKLCAYFAEKRFHRTETDGAKVYVKHLTGFYGSFLTHLSFLLILVIGAAAVVTADVSDQVVMPGETLTLKDGTAVTVERFQIEDETGRLDYASQLTVSSPDGKKTLEQLIRVNEPLSFGSYKIYQQTYGTAGCVRVNNLDTGASEDMTLTESCFLTLDGRNGLFFQALYPGYVQAEDGSVTLVTSTSGAYTDPVYDVLSVADGAMTPVLAFPGETLTIGAVSFTMLDPVSYPGLRIKHVQPAVLGALYAVFVLMVTALYMCFFMPPVAVKVTPEGCAVLSPKPQTGLHIELEALFEKEDA